MKVCLLYENRERAANAPYYDQKSIIQDLGLSAVFSAAAKELTYENGELKQVEAADLFVLETFRNVMMTPLLSAGDRKGLPADAETDSRAVPREHRDACEVE